MPKRTAAGGDLFTVLLTETNSPEFGRSNPTGRKQVGVELSVGF
jgi:hypothetical protein